MKGALIILAALLAIGAVLRLTDPLFRRRALRQNPADPPAAEETVADTDAPAGECCGQHLICEKTSLTPLDTHIEYFDDEELDSLARRDPASYTDAETEALRDVLLTLRPEEVPAWTRSLQLRQIALPEAIRDEILLIAADIRFGNA